MLALQKTVKIRIKNARNARHAIGKVQVILMRSLCQTVEVKLPFS